MKLTYPDDARCCADAVAASSRTRKMSGAVVVTVSQSVLTKRIANAFGLKIHETPIGFKYVADLMLKEDIL